VTSIIAIVIGVVAVPAAVLFYVIAGEGALRAAPGRTRAKVRPWVWLLPVIIGIGGVLIYPSIATLVLSFRGSTGAGWAGFKNFAWAVGPDNWVPFLNNAIWIVLLPVGTAVIGVVMAVLLDRIRYETVARVLLVLPTAISLTAAAVSWRLLYDWEPNGRVQLGVFNAVLQWFHIAPVAWTARPPGALQWLNTVSLVGVGVWSGLGVAVLVLSAAVKAVPAELLEAGRLDGAGELGVFWHIVLPYIWPSVLTVLTTQVITAIKIFDIVYVMTNGNSGTQVVANQMFTELFDYPSDLGRASAIAVILMILTVPVVWFNIHTARREAQSA
jgi:alpha-glucoside transport system permease protein